MAGVSPRSEGAFYAVLHANRKTAEFWNTLFFTPLFVIKSNLMHFSYPSTCTLCIKTPLYMRFMHTDPPFYRFFGLKVVSRPGGEAHFLRPTRHMHFMHNRVKRLKTGRNRGLTYSNQCANVYLGLLDRPQCSPRYRLNG